MMHRRLLGTAYAALVVAGAVSAQAADLPTRKEAPAPVFIPPPFTWTGFYIGANAGGIWSSGGNASTTFFAPDFPIFSANFPNVSFGQSKSGFIGGGQAGYNWQTGSFVLGVETDFDGTTLSRSRSVIGPSFVDNNFVNDNFTANGSVRLNWLGSTRARVGWAVTPDNRLMIYGTGGVAYGGGSAHLNIFDADPANGFIWSSGSNSATRTGWTIGGGVEYAITNNIILGAEYLYYDLGSRTLSAVPNVTATNFFGDVFSSTKVNFDGSAFRARVSYKF
jgi:outer membrane immunogenic protein